MWGETIVKIIKTANYKKLEKSALWPFNKSPQQESPDDLLVPGGDGGGIDSVSDEVINQAAEMAFDNIQRNDDEINAEIYAEKWLDYFFNGPELKAFSRKIVIGKIMEQIKQLIEKDFRNNDQPTRYKGQDEGMGPGSYNREYSEI